MSHPVQNVAPCTSLGVANICEGELEAEAAVSPGPVLGGTEDRHGAPHAHQGGGAALGHRHSSTACQHLQPGEVRVTPPLLSASSHDVVLGLRLAVDLNSRVVTNHCAARYLPSVPSASVPLSGHPTLDLGH